MSAAQVLKTAFISTVLAASAFSGAAHAQEKELGADGLYKEPICGYAFRIKKSLSILVGEEPTGIKEANGKWDMEIYADPKDNLISPQAQIHISRYLQ